VLKVVNDFNKDLDEINNKAIKLKALSHPVRLCIVRGLMAEEGYNVSEMQGCINIPQSTLSQHLTKLRDLGILEGVRNGVEINYYVSDEDTKRIIKTLFNEH